MKRFGKCNESGIVGGYVLAKLPSSGHEREVIMKLDTKLAEDG